VATKLEGLEQNCRGPVPSGPGLKPAMQPGHVKKAAHHEPRPVSGRGRKTAALLNFVF